MFDRIENSLRGSWWTRFPILFSHFPNFRGRRLIPFESDVVIAAPRRRQIRYFYFFFDTWKFKFLFQGGLFGLGTIQKPKDFRTLTDHVHEKGRVLLAEALAGPQRKRKVVAILDELSDTICQAADMVSSYQWLNFIFFTGE